MGVFRVEIDPAALRQLRRIDPQNQRRIAKAIDALAQNPFPPGCRQLVGRRLHWRIRMGDYRAIYTVFHAEIRVLVLKVGHRRDVYRDM